MGFLGVLHVVFILKSPFPKILNILLMVQKSGVHQLRLNSLSYDLPGFLKHQLCILLICDFGCTALRCSDAEHIWVSDSCHGNLGIQFFLFPKKAAKRVSW